MAALIECCTGDFCERERKPWGLKNVVIEVEKNDISEQSKDVVSQVMAGRSDEKQMENVEGMVS